MNKYEVGETVTANITAQGMTEGQSYTVVKTIEDLTGWGTYRTYILADENGTTLQIQNGHIILCNATCGCSK